MSLKVCVNSHITLNSHYNHSSFKNYIVKFRRNNTASEVENTQKMIILHYEF